jgi:streptomycin 6-kinase
MIVPAGLRQSCAGDSGREAWLDSLPRTIDELGRRWSLKIGPPVDGEDVSCSWVAPAVREDGTRAVLKIGLPHMEGRDEIAGLRYWDGDPFVHLLDADEDVNAMLLEHCVGPSLRHRPEPEQDDVIARLLRRVWRTPAPPHSFRPLSAMIEYWIDETESRRETWLDPGLVTEGLDVFRALCRHAAGDVLLATDLHAGNVLAAEREPWLAIDPKPFVGDPAYDATQHLLNCRARLRQDPRGTVRRFADLLEVDAERVRLWLFARLAAGPCPNPSSLIPDPRIPDRGSSNLESLIREIRDSRIRDSRIRDSRIRDEG